MKNKKRIIGLLVAILLVAAAAVTVIAETEAPVYNGKVSTMEKKIGFIDSAETFSDRLDALDGAVEYLEKINPEAPEYNGFVAALDVRELLTAYEYVAQSLSADTADGMVKQLKNYLLWEAEHPFADTALFTDDKGTPDTADDVVYDAVGYYAKREEVKSAIAEKYLNESIASTDAKSKHAVLDKLLAFTSEYGAAYAGGYTKEALEAENYACAQLIVSEITPNLGTAKMGAAIRSINGFMEDHYFPMSVPGYTSFIEDIAKKASSFESAAEKAKYELELLAHIGDYSKTPTVNRDFNKIEGQVSINSVGALVPDYNTDGDINYVVENDSGMDGNNGYYTINYGKSGTHIRTNVNIPTTLTDSLVFECDFTTFDYLPNNSIIFENGTKKVNNVEIPRVYIRITPSGDIMSYDNKTVLVENGVTPGEWTHIAFVMNQVTSEIKIYVDYELVRTDVLTKDGYTAPFERIRIGGTPSLVGGSFSLDNVKLYAGYAPRAKDAYNSYSDENKFNFAVKQITNVNLSYLARVEYYKEAEKNVSKYWDGMSYTTTNASVRASLDSFFSFTDNGYASLVETIMNENLGELEVRIDKLAKQDAGESTYALRTYLADETDAFLLRAGEYLPDGEKTSSLRAALDEARIQLAKEDVLLEFASAVKKFDTAATLEDLKAAHKLANDLYASLDRSILKPGLFPSYDEAYEKFLTMDERLADNVTIDNTKTLVAYITYLIPFDTEEKWNENYDSLKGYVSFVRSIIEEGDYDIYYSNIAELLVKFAPMNDYFYGRLQSDHIAYISSELTRFSASKAYFEKYGILIKLQDYIAENEIDYTNADIINFITIIDTELADLEDEKDGYAALLDTNTEKFIKCCEGLIGSISYAEMKKICTEAAEYYYAMNVTGPEAQDAIAVYVSRCRELEETEKKAELFIDAVGGFDIEDSDVLETIILASRHLVGLETEIEGVKDALTRYNTEIAIFNAEAERGNAEIIASVKGALGVSNNGRYSSLVTSVIEKVTLN